MSRPPGRGVLVALIILAVLGGGAVAVDALARSTVENRASGELTSQLMSSSPLEVSIGGWPFLAFLVTDRVESVRITGEDVTLTRDGRSITLASVDATATGVSNPRALDDAVADRVEAVGVLPWSGVTSEVGVDVSFAGDGRLQARETIEILGTSFEVVFSAVPGVDASTQRFTLTDSQAGVGPVTTTAGLLDTLVNRLAEAFVLPELAGLTYQTARATEAGLEVAVEGESVSVASLR